MRPTAPGYGGLNWNAHSLVVSATTIAASIWAVLTALYCSCRPRTGQWSGKPPYRERFWRRQWSQMTGLLCRPMTASYWVSVLALKSPHGHSPVMCRSSLYGVPQRPFWSEVMRLLALVMARLSQSMSTLATSLGRRVLGCRKVVPRSIVLSTWMVR